MISQNEPLSLQERFDKLVARLRASTRTEREYLSEHDFPALGPDAVPLLLAVLVASNAEDQYDFVTALGMIGDDRAIEPVFALLRTDDEDLVISVVHALPRLPGLDRARLRALLRDPEPTIRARACYVLRQLKDAEAGDLFLALLDDANDEVRAQAILAVGAIDDRQAIPQLLRLIDSPHHSQQTFAREVLATWKEPHMAAMLLQHVAEGKLEDDTVYQLELLGDQRAVPFLLPLLEHEDHFVRYEAVMALRAIQPEVLVPHLPRLLEDGYHETQLQAAHMLETWGEPAMIPRLEALVQSEHQPLAEAAQKAIQRIRG